MEFDNFFGFQAILLDIIEPFNIEDGEWTMKIRIRDETHENLDCYISHQLLCRLIGMTPDEAVVSFLF